MVLLFECYCMLQIVSSQNMYKNSCHKLCRSTVFSLSLFLNPQAANGSLRSHASYRHRFHSIKIFGISKAFECLYTMNYFWCFDVKKMKNLQHKSRTTNTFPLIWLSNSCCSETAERNDAVNKTIEAHTRIQQKRREFLFCEYFIVVL